MTTKDNNINTMMENAINNIGETLEPISEKVMNANPYKINQDLEEEGFTYDDTGVYIPFKPHFQNMDNENITTRDDIYLWVSRNLDKKIELQFKWAKKTKKGFHKTRVFKTDFTLDIGDEKTLKKLNQKVSYAGGKNGNPSTENTYVSFVDYFIDKIIESECLEILKEDTFEPQEIAIEDTQTNEEKANVPQTFSDYPENIQHEALKIINEGKVFDEMQTSVSLTHKGHHTTRNALILMESSLFTGDGVHGNLGGESGMGKTDLALTGALLFPDKHVHIISSNTPKEMFYDFESYDDKFNIIIFDDIVLNDEIIRVIKLLTDNRVKEKVHKTLDTSGKPLKLKLKGTYEVIITYAKDLPDEELANRLFNLGVSIVDKDETDYEVQDKDETDYEVKEQIRDNGIRGGNENLIFKRKRLMMQACIHYLIEQDIKVYNPYLSIFNPEDYIYRDITNFENMTKARTFFDYAQREQIQIHDELSLTIGSYDDIHFVHDIWAKDGEAQKYKLSELQKRTLELLRTKWGEMTQEEAFDHIVNLNNELEEADSRAYKQTLLDNEPTLKNIAKELKVNPSTLKHSLDRFTEGNKKSLLELGLIYKIKLDEDKHTSPNLFFIIKNEGDISKSNESNVQNMQIQFAYDLNSSIVKQKIIIDLLLYANIIINKKGMYALKKYCENYKHKLDVEDYKQLIDFLQGFFNILDYDENIISLTNASSDDINNMMNFEKEIKNQLQKERHTSSDQKTQEICTSTKQEENSLNTKQSKNQNANKKSTYLHIGNIRFKEQMDNKHIDVEIACQTYEALKTKPAQTLQEITNYICKYDNPEDYEQEPKPLKIQVNLKKLCENNYINSYYKHNTQVYDLEETFIDLIENAQEVKSA